jgi:phosphoglycolate phosphatase-like HAD superfamily hydrolase
MAAAGAEAFSMNKLSRRWDTFDAYMFDIDGTLLRCEDAVHYFAFCDVMQSIAGRPLTLEGVVAHGNTDIGILRDAFALAGVSENAWRSKLELIRQSMCSFVRAREQELRITVLPHVRDVLEHLQSRKAVIGVATGNLQGIGEMKLKRAGLLEYFSFGGWSDGCEYRNDVFRNAVAQVKALTHDAASICVIGDTPSDIRAARQNSLTAIAVATGIYSLEQLSAERPDMCLQSLGELVSAAEALPA